MTNAKTSLLPGIFLIFLGLILLIHKLDIFYFDWYKTYPFIFALIGLTLVLSAIFNKSGSATFWGTVFLLFGALFIVRNYGVVDYFYFHQIWPVFFLIFGIAFIVLFIVKPQDWGVLIPGSIFLFIGISFLLRNYHFWRFQEIVARYWPLLFILIGIFIILGSLRHKS